MIQNDEIKWSLTEIPFKTTLSFKYLIDEIKIISKDAHHPLKDSAKKILEELKQAPELTKQIDNFKLIDTYQPLINKLMSFVFNPTKGDLDISAASPPFTPKPFFSTKLFDETFRGKHRTLKLAKEAEEDRMFIAIIYQAYLVILNEFYEFDIDLDMPFIFKLTDEKEGTVNYFKMKFNSKYTGVKIHGELDALSKEEIKEMFDRASDLDFWNEKIPLNKFEFTGFLQFDYTNITQEYVISQLKSKLLDKNAIITLDGFSEIKEKVSALLQLPDLEFGLAAVNDFGSNANQNMIWKTIIPQSELKCKEYQGTLYEMAYAEKRIVLTNDFQELENNPVVEAFLKRGLRSHVVVPLMIEDEVVGMIEFSSSEPGWLSLIQVNRFQELFPVFALALKRSKEEWNDRVRALIQEEFTAIHPTVAWRFIEAASAILADNSQQDIVKRESITFPDVFPIYGATDIRNSSVERNKAIQADLSEHLSLIKSILTVGKRNKEMPLLDNLAFKIEHHMQTVYTGLKSGDEVSILEFIKKEIDPVFKQLRLRDKNMADRVDAYFLRMDDDLGVLYNKRKDFEDSLTKINDEVGLILDAEQVKAQKVFPHYFEKYRTDGVEYNAYIGQSLVKDHEYDKIYLKNIRLWQILTMVSIARKIRRIQPNLKTRLDVTQLILVQSSPLSIAFRQDEKKFDVAGAYNIRYEITKKRIDKAAVKGTRERVTQVGKIAIIYSLADEIDEYRSYISYLIAEGFLKDTIEYLELEDLQGASGLRALRVEIDFSDFAALDEIDISDIERLVRNS